ncbi:hypothetical protein [Streptomyces prunicolor]|uniref:hypothetical protein n=1 Tax=Streptomyces prunicolor TaxID=67348 RepID=UPI00342FBA0B
MTLGDLAGIPDLSPLRELTQLTYLFLSDGVRGLNVLADLPQLCELGLDLAPLATHPALIHITTPPTCRLLNAAKLPTTIKLN